MSAPLGFILPGTAFLLTVVLGFRVSRLGRPYHRLLFNVHKPLALGAVAAAVVQVVRSLNEAPRQL